MIKAFEKNECGILDELEEFDPDDEYYQLVMDMPFINLDNCLEVIE